MNLFKANKNNTLLYFTLILECDKGFYGLECNETCGHCRDVSQCSNIDGTCIAGCAASFEGVFCKTREYTMIKEHFLSFNQVLFVENENLNDIKLKIRILISQLKRITVITYHPCQWQLRFFSSKKS